MCWDERSNVNHADFCYGNLLSTLVDHDCQGGISGYCEKYWDGLCNTYKRRWSINCTNVVTITTFFYQKPKDTPESCVNLHTRVFLENLWEFLVTFIGSGHIANTKITSSRYFTESMERVLYEHKINASVLLCINGKSSL